MLFLQCIGDFERISDHAVSIVKSFEEMKIKEQEFSNKAQIELGIFTQAVAEMLNSTLEVFDKEDAKLAYEVESLSAVITELSAEVRKRHIKRLRKGKCTIELGFLLSDIVTSCERIALHCSHIVVSVMQVRKSPWKCMVIWKISEKMKRQNLNSYRRTLRKICFAVK